MRAYARVLVPVVSRAHLAAEHSRLLVAAGPRRHPAAADEGGEVQPAAHRAAAHHRLHPHLGTSDSDMRRKRRRRRGEEEEVNDKEK